MSAGRQQGDHKDDDDSSRSSSSRLAAGRQTDDVALTAGVLAEPEPQRALSPRASSPQLQCQHPQSPALSEAPVQAAAATRHHAAAPSTSALLSDTARLQLEAPRAAASDILILKPRQPSPISSNSIDSDSDNPSPLHDPGVFSRRRARSHTGVTRGGPPFSPPPPSLRPRHGASSSFSHASSSRFNSSSSLGLCPDPFWTPLSSILHSLPQSPRPPSTMFAAANLQSQAQSQPQAKSGPDLVEVQTDSIGFLAVSGESKIRLLPTPWPADSLPKPTSSLLSIASRSELVAAAGPNTLVIGTTTAVRDAFSSGVSAENNIKPFTPQLSLDTPHLSQVAFSSDESSLVISAEQGGGLAVYDVQALKQGSKDSAFQLATNGVAVRALIPNPAPESAHMFAVVLADGKFMLADLKERALTQGPNGVVLKDGVSCVSWSAKGKQIVAGLGDGSAVQLGPDGSVKAQIPSCPGLPSDHHVSGVSWLDNDHFLLIYTPTNFDLGHPPDSTFVYVSREPKTTNFTFQKLPDPVPPFGMNRSPPHHFVSRLRHFPPTLTDTLILASTASSEVGLITRSTTPLSSSATDSVNQYAATGIIEDSRKAQIPPNDAMEETSPIGLALDLSSKDPVKRPIPSDEMDASATPLPNLMMLSNEGVLCSWWFVYSDSIKQGQAFPGLVAAANTLQAQSQTTIQGASTFGATFQSQSPFASANANTIGASPFAQQSSATFGTPSTPATGSAFGASGALGGNKSPWATAGGSTSTPQTGMSAFGKPAFGSSTPIGAGSGFGSTGGLGNRASPWATPAQNQQPSDNKPANPFSNTSAASPFASMAQQPAATASPFSSSSATSGFASLGQQTTKPLFGAATTTTAPALSNQPSFGSTMTIGSNFGSSFGGPSTLGEPRSAWGTPSLSNDNSAGSGNRAAFGTTASPETEMTSGDMDNDMDTEKPAEAEDKKPEEAPSGLFGTGTSGFKLGSSFKPDPNAKDDTTKPSGPSLFGSAFGDALGGPRNTTSNAVPDATKADDTDKQKENAKPKDSAPFSFNLNRDQPQQAAKSSDFDLSKVKVEGQDESANTQPTTSTFIPPASKQEAPPSKPGSDSSWETVQKSPVGEPAPLPPSPPSTSRQQIEEPPLPPMPTGQESIEEPPLPPMPTGKEVIEDAPLPPMPTGKEVIDDAPLPPMPTGKEVFDDVPLPPMPSRNQVSNEQPPPPLPSSTTPARQNQAPSLFSTTPVAPPPRSPSPHKPHQFRETLSTTPTAPPPVKSSPAPRSVSKPLFSQRRSQLSSTEQSPARAVSRTAPEPEPIEEYVDDSDVRIQEELSSPIEPTKQLAPFIAHQDYVGKVPGQGVSAQIERVYRDIQSMIDTLGLNARSLKAFVVGNENFKDGGRIREDLEEGREDDWCLIEIADLGAVEKEISGNLEDQRLQDAGDMVADLQTMQKSLAKLRARHHGLQQTIRAYQNPEQNEESQRNELRNPLSAEQSLVLVELRKAFTEFQTLIAQVEDSITVLRAKLASAQASSDGDQSGSPTKVPTFEAVANTINKMTRMVEQKSGDVDVLESQMRKLRLKQGKGAFDTSGSLDEALGRMTLGSSVSHDQGRFRTPPSSRGRASAYKKGSSASGGNGTFQLSYESQSDEEDFGSSVRASPGSRRGKGVGASVSHDQVVAYAAMAARREKIMGLFKKKLCERGTYVRGP